MSTIKAIFNNRRSADETLALIASFAAGVIITLAFVDFM